MPLTRPHDREPAGKGMRERLSLLADAIHTGDESLIDDFSSEELWMVAKMWGSHDDGLEQAMQTAREVGLWLINPFRQHEGFEDELLCVFPEFASR